MYRYIVETKAHSPVCSLEGQPRLNKSCRIQIKNQPTLAAMNSFQVAALLLRNIT